MTAARRARCRGSRPGRSRSPAPRRRRPALRSHRTGHARPEADPESDRRSALLCIRLATSGNKPKFFLICPLYYMILLLRPDVAQSNVLFRSSVILHVDRSLCPRDSARAQGGSYRGAALELPAGALFGLGGRAAAQSSDVSAMHAGWQGYGRRLSRSSVVMDRSCRARPTALSDGPGMPRWRFCRKKPRDVSEDAARWRCFPAAGQSLRQLAKHIRR